MSKRISLIAVIAILAIITMTLLSITSWTVRAEDHSENSVRTTSGQADKEHHVEERDHDHEEGFVDHDEHDHDESDNEHREEDEHGHGDEEQGHEEEVVKLSDAELEEFGIEIDRAKPGILYMQLTLPGEISVNEDQLAHIVPRLEGVVRRVFKKVGDDVVEGDIMAVLDSTELGEVKANYLAKLQNIELAQADYDRAKTVHDNTVKILELLKTSPDLDELQNIIELNSGRNLSDLIEAYADAVLTKITFAREKQLFEKEISSESTYLEAENAYKKAQASFIARSSDITYQNQRQFLEASRNLDVANIELRTVYRNLGILGLIKEQIQELTVGDGADEDLGRYVIQSSIAGTILEKHIVLGELVQQDTAVFTVADLNSVWVNVTVYPKDLPVIEKGRHVNILEKHGLKGVKGEISYISSIIDEETRTAYARVILDNHDRRWRPGQFVTAQITVDDIEVPVIIPKTALQTFENRTVVFIKTPKGFEPQPVETGLSDITNIEIKSGLKPGQSIVSRGAFTIKAQMQKASFGGGHSH